MINLVKIQEDNYKIKKDKFYLTSNIFFWKWFTARESTKLHSKIKKICSGNWKMMMFCTVKIYWNHFSEKIKKNDELFVNYLFKISYNKVLIAIFN